MGEVRTPNEHATAAAPPVPIAAAAKQRIWPILWHLLWLVVILIAYQLWAKFTLGYDVMTSAVVTATAAAVSFAVKVLVSISKRTFRDAAKEAAHLATDDRVLGVLTVLLAVLAVGLSSIHIVNDTTAKGVDVTVASLTTPSTHYIPDLSTSNGAKFRSLVFAPFGRDINVATPGRKCRPTQAYPVVPSEVYLSSCDPKPAVLIRIPVGAHMHLVNGILEVTAGNCKIRHPTGKHVAGVWIGAETSPAEQWRQKWKKDLADDGITGDDAQAVIDVWTSSPLHECSFGTMFSVTATFYAQQKNPFAVLGPATIRFDEKPVDLELTVRR